MLSFCATTADFTRSDALAAELSDPSDFTQSDTFSGFLFGSNNALDAAYDRTQKWKKDNGIPITIGAHHWWHVDRDARIYGNGYGVPGSRGTYYYIVALDPSLKISGDGPINEIGFHNQTRFRDAGDKLRSFYDETIWTYENYAYAKTDIGTFKAGQIVQQFGIPWDNSWWEGVPYFDGYRFNPAWGVSWENTWTASASFKIDTAFQYFIRHDRVSGAIAGADAESSPPNGERNTLSFRVLPQWTFNADSKVALGVSGFTREIEDASPVDLDSRQTAYAIDLSYTWRNLSLYAQYTDSYGAAVPARYVSGGPSNRQNSYEIGANYKIGPISAHLNYSEGWDHNPSGDQTIINPGVTVQLSKALTLYTEYVKWDVTDRAGTSTKFDDGYELILVWNY